VLTAVASSRRYFYVRKNTAIGYDIAFGAARFGDAVEGLATRLNFTEQAGIVLQRRIGANSALTLNYRFCHISNAGTQRPNVGVNASMLSLGITRFM
jgi:lipid A 3-O-deacylase